MAGPQYREIARDLRRKISSGELAQGSQLPTEDDLMESYDASRNTVRGAIRELSIRGLVYTLHGKGTFVTEDVPPIVTTLTMDPAECRRVMVTLPSVCLQRRRPRSGLSPRQWARSRSGS